jgi:hypothetical protein
MRLTKIEIENDLNTFVNNLTFNKNHKYRDIEIRNKIDNYIRSTFYDHDIIYDWKVNCGYPNVEVFIHIHKGFNIEEIKLVRFERLKKLKKLEDVNR